jgi:hypothetical protein
MLAGYSCYSISLYPAVIEVSGPIQGTQGSQFGRNYRKHVLTLHLHVLPTRSRSLGILCEMVEVFYFVIALSGSSRSNTKKDYGYFYVIGQWLSHCATSRKVAGSRPNKVIFSNYLILSAALGPGVYSACNRNEYQKHNVSGQ